MTLYQKGLFTYDMDHMTEEEAKAESRVFYQIYQEYHRNKIEKNRKKIEKVLDKRLKK